MTFAYSLNIQGEFLAIDEQGKITARTPVHGELALDKAALTSAAERLLTASDEFIASHVRPPNQSDAKAPVRRPLWPVTKEDYREIEKSASEVAQIFAKYRAKK